MALSKSILCEEKLRLMEGFLAAAADLVARHNAHAKAVIDGDPDSNRFDQLIKRANERKKKAKHEYIEHLRKHRCWTEV